MLGQGRGRNDPWGIVVRMEPGTDLWFFQRDKPKDRKQYLIDDRKLLRDGVEGIIRGASAGGFHEDVLTVDPAFLRADFEVNAVAPVRLFQAAWPLLEKKAAAAGEAKFVLITSSVGSIAITEQEAMPGVSYGASKAAANWISKKISVEMKSKNLRVGIIHPG